MLLLMGSTKGLPHKMDVLLPPDLQKLPHEVFLLVLILKGDKQVNLKHVLIFVLI